MAGRAPAAGETRTAGQGGNVLAAAVIAAGLAFGSFFMGLLLAFYIWSTARAELIQVILRTGRPPTL